MLYALLVEDLQDAHAWVGHLEANPAQLFGFLFHDPPPHTAFPSR
jgi:hypothetical protein